MDDMVIKYIIGVLGFLVVNYYAMKSLLAGMRVEVHEIKAQNNRNHDEYGRRLDALEDRTRFVMTGNEIRRIISEEVDPLTGKIDRMHEDVIILKAKYRDPNAKTRSTDL